MREDVQRLYDKLDELVDVYESERLEVADLISDLQMEVQSLKEASKPELASESETIPQDIFDRIDELTDNIRSIVDVSSIDELEGEFEDEDELPAEEPIEAPIAVEPSDSIEPPVMPEQQPEAVDEQPKAPEVGTVVSGN